MPAGRGFGSRENPDVPGKESVEPPAHARDRHSGGLRRQVYVGHLAVRVHPGVRPARPLDAQPDAVHPGERVLHGRLDGPGGAAPVADRILRLPSLEVGPEVREVEPHSPRRARRTLRPLVVPHPPIIGSSPAVSSNSVPPMRLSSRLSAFPLVCVCGFALAGEPRVNRFAGGEASRLASVYWFRTDRGSVLVDAPLLLAEGEKLRAEMTAAGALPLGAVLLTNGRPERSWGLGPLLSPGTRVWASRATATTLERRFGVERDGLLRAGLPFAGMPRTPPRVTNPFTGSREFRLTDRSQLTPGEITPDNRGGWLYNERTGQVWLDSEPEQSQIYQRSWLVEMKNQQNRGE